MALRTGYGTGVYTVGKYGLPQVYEGAAATTITTTTVSSAQRIGIGAVIDTSTSGVVVTAQRIQNGIVADNITTTATAIGYTALAGAATVNVTSSVSLYWNRVRPFSAADTVSVVMTPISRYKWIDTSTASVTWADADYREGAA